jgi:uncharacterized lipoprotein YajG
MIRNTDSSRHASRSRRERVKIRWSILLMAVALPLLAACAQEEAADTATMSPATPPQTTTEDSITTQTVVIPEDAERPQYEGGSLTDDRQSAPGTTTTTGSPAPQPLPQPPATST